jgi:hypothetical protein
MMAHLFECAPYTSKAMYAEGRTFYRPIRSRNDGTGVPTFDTADAPFGHSG